MGDRRSVHSLHRQRGQTVPFWTLAIIAVLALTFFVANYANTIRWQIRAQNAADVAAHAGAATDATVNNQVTTMLYIAAIEEMRIRYLNQAILNTINSIGCSTSASCDADYLALRTQFNAAVARFQTIVQDLYLIEATGMWDASLRNSPDRAVGLVTSKTHCDLFDCAFDYAASYDATNDAVDVVACATVPTLAAALLGPGAHSTFQAVGRSVATVGLLSIESFTPGLTGNPWPTNGGAPNSAVFQPDEAPPAGVDQVAAYTTSFRSLTVNLPWYVTEPTRPQTAATSPCPS